MRTDRTIRVTFSADGMSVDVRMPRSWADLTQPELRRVYEIMTTIDYDVAAQRLAVFRTLTCVRVERRTDDGLWMLRFQSGKRVRRLFVSAEQLAGQLECLAWMSEPGDVPARLDRWNAKSSPEAVDAQLHGVPFGDYLRLENLYQGFLQSKKVYTILAMARILYPGLESNRPLESWQILNVTQWMVQVKLMFSRLFPNFFRPVSSGGETPSMVDVMNSEIRALTGGDVTKEDVILSTDCWRALTELDFKAKEAEELRREMARHKQ